MTRSPSTADVSSTTSSQLSFLPKLCRWCKAPLAAERRVDAQFCPGKCRQTAFRLRRRRNAFHGPNDRLLTFAYADPPYPGLAAKYYADRPDYGGEVDHRELISRLESSGYAGWALSTSAAALRDVLPLCPPGARVCAWVKPGGCPPASYGLHNRWEPVIVVGGRMRQPGLRDWLHAQPARGGGELPGRKPLEFCVWLFELLGMLAGDSLVDLFPGTGVVSRSWHELSSSAATRHFNTQHSRHGSSRDGSLEHGSDEEPSLTAASRIRSPADTTASIRG